MASEVLRSLSAGAAFGAALTASRVYLPSVIRGQMNLTDFHMLEVFLTATAASALIIVGFERLAFAKRKIPANSTMNLVSKYDGNLLGGAMIGFGMSLTGACPGTVLVQLAHGIPSSLITAIGAVAGGMVSARYGTMLRKNTVAPTHITIDQQFGIKPQTGLLWLEILFFSIVGLSAAFLPGKAYSNLPTIVSGLLIAGAQAASILLTSSPLSVSGAYGDIGGLIWHLLGFKDTPTSGRISAKIIFSLGILIGSWGLSTHLALPRVVETTPVSPIEALIGGFVMVFGAGLAGGCTSGHGISGLASMSFSSLLTVCGMFGAGIATELLRSR